jgi:outer membrane protein insertion porin family
MRIEHRLAFFLAWFAALQFLSGCNVTKHLDTSKEERLLVKNTLSFTPQSKVGIGKARSLRYQTTGLFRQKPNRQTLRTFPRLAAHYKYKEKKGKFANFVNKNFAEPPSLLDTNDCRVSARYFQNFMRKRGYFNATCTYQITNEGKYKAKVKYILDFGPLYTISALTMTSKDTAIANLLYANRGDSKLAVGKAVSSEQFDNEKNRLRALLRNNGYYQMTPNYIEYTGDSTGTSVAVNIEVLPYSDDKVTHPKYTIGAVTVFSSLVPDVGSIRNDSIYKGIQYFSNETKFFIKPKHLDKAIKVRPGALYNQSKLDITYRRISNMGAFNFVKIQPVPDSLRQDTLNVNVFFSPANKMGIGPDFNVRYITPPGLIGVPLSIAFKHRNLFRGAELLQTNLTANAEFDIGTRTDNLLYLWEGRLQNYLVFPRFFDYAGMWRSLHKVRLGNRRLVSTNLYNNLRNDAKTTVGLNANITDVSNFATFGQLDATMGIELKSRNSTYSFTHIGLDWLQYLNFDSIFEAIKDRSPLFALRTSDQLFTGFLLRTFSYSYRSNVNGAGERYSARFSTDLSGMEVELLNQVFQRNKIWKLGYLDFAKYLRLEGTGAYSRTLRKGVAWGVSLNTGFIIPFGRRTDPSIPRSTPFVKQFSVGGPSGLRAWRVREVGPGTHYVPNAEDNNFFFQASDFKFEFISEFRFPIFWVFNGAVFFDGGNIWSFRPERERLGARWYRNSWQDLALGTGFGLRMDFDYFVIRFDYGMKLRKPYLEENSDNHWYDWRQGSTRNFINNIGNLNVAVGYPF